MAWSDVLLKKTNNYNNYSCYYLFWGVCWYSQDQELDQSKDLDLYQDQDTVLWYWRGGQVILSQTSATLVAFWTLVDNCCGETELIKCHTTHTHFYCVCRAQTKLEPNKKEGAWHHQIWKVTGQRSVEAQQQQQQQCWCSVGWAGTMSDLCLPLLHGRARQRCLREHHTNGRRDVEEENKCIVLRRKGWLWTWQISYVRERSGGRRWVTKSQRKMNLGHLHRCSKSCFSKPQWNFWVSAKQHHHHKPFLPEEEHSGTWQGAGRQQLDMQGNSSQPQSASGWTVQRTQDQDSWLEATIPTKSFIDSPALSLTNSFDICLVNISCMFIGLIFSGVVSITHSLFQACCWSSQPPTEILILVMQQSFIRQLVWGFSRWLSDAYKWVQKETDA